MKVKYLKEWNTSQSYIAAGTECDISKEEATPLIVAGIAEEVKEKKERKDASN
jgi:hypothetical protein